MAESAGTAVVDIVGNVAPLDASLAEAEARTRQHVANISRTFNTLTRGGTDAGRSVEQLAQRMRRLSDTAREGHTAFTRTRAAVQLVSLQFSQAREAGLSFTQSLAASSSAATLLGGVIVGTLIARALVALGRALIDATTQFARVRNEMQQLTVFSGNVAKEFQFLKSVSDNSNTSFKDLAKQYIELSKQAVALGVSQDVVREKFEEFNRVMKERSETTVGGAFSKLLDDIGTMVAKLDNATGASKLFISALQGLAAAAKGIGNFFGGGETDADPAIIEGRRLQMLQETIAKYDVMIAQLRKRGDEEGKINLLQGLRMKLLDEEEKSYYKLAELTKDVANPEDDIKRIGTKMQLIEQLEHERQLIGLGNSEQEVRNRLLQIELQFRQMGMSLSAQEKADMEVRLRVNKELSDTYERLRESFSVYMDRVEGSRTIFDELNFSWTNHAEIVEKAIEKIKLAYGDSVQSQIMQADVRRRLALQEQRQILETASLAAQTITALWPKQKGAAIAAAVINTGVGVTKALTGSTPPWNIIQAGLVAAMGAAQIASIRSTSLSGGSVSGVSGGTGGIAQVQPQEATPIAPNRAVNIYMPKGEFFSSDQMQKFIERLNEEVSQGATLISTKTAPT